MRKLRSQVYSVGELRARVTVTRWLRRLVGVEIWTPIDGGAYHYTLIKDK